MTSVQVANNFRLRRTFGRIKKIVDIPNLIDIQQRSYEDFLQRDVAPESRADAGLQGVFKSVFPIKDFNETASLEFVSYTLGELEDGHVADRVENLVLAHSRRHCSKSPGVIKSRSNDGSVSGYCCRSLTDFQALPPALSR